MGWNVTERVAGTVWDGKEGDRARRQQLWQLDNQVKQRVLVTAVTAVGRRSLLWFRF